MKNADDTVQLPGGLGHNICDSTNIRRQGFRPEFNKCFSLHCCIPEHSIVELSLMDAGGLTEQMIGSTVRRLKPVRTMKVSILLICII